jgi:mRNA interferase MazF
MAITFHPKAGMILMCDFKGLVAPEIIKTRPVVIISPNNIVRSGLCTVVPLSTTAPDPVQAYHYQIPHDPLRNGAETWAKCDLVMSVSCARLDRIKLGRGQYITGAVNMDHVRELRRRAALSFGFAIAEE